MGNYANSERVDKVDIIQNDIRDDGSYKRWANRELNIPKENASEIPIWGSGAYASPHAH